MTASAVIFDGVTESAPFTTVTGSAYAAKDKFFWASDTGVESLDEGTLYTGTASSIVANYHDLAFIGDDNFFYIGSDAVLDLATVSVYQVVATRDSFFIVAEGGSLGAVDAFNETNRLTFHKFIGTVAVDGSVSYVYSTTSYDHVVATPGAAGFLLAGADATKAYALLLSGTTDVFSNIVYSVIIADSDGDALIVETGSALSGEYYDITFLGVPYFTEFAVAGFSDHVTFLAQQYDPALSVKTRILFLDSTSGKTTVDTGAGSNLTMFQNNAVKGKVIATKEVAYCIPGAAGKHYLVGSDGTSFKLEDQVTGFNVRDMLATKLRAYVLGTTATPELWHITDEAKVLYDAWVASPTAANLAALGVAVFQYEYPTAPTSNCAAPNPSNILRMQEIEAWNA